MEGSEAAVVSLLSVEVQHLNGYLAERSFSFCYSGKDPLLRVYACLSDLLCRASPLNARSRINFIFERVPAFFAW